MSRKFPVIVVLVVALLASGAARWLASLGKDSLSPGEASLAAGEARGETLGRLNSFALALLLGGLRGPLVMALWTSSEDQKTSRDLSDFDTKIELIRLLQPQFDTVHLYQVWNKAYNVSADVTSPAGKYAAILDAIDYADKVIAERPDNINLETQLGEIYNNKLGAAQERDYYATRVYDETRADEPATRITFPAALEGEFRDTALRAGISPRRLGVQRSQRAGHLVAVVRRSEGRAIREGLDAKGVTYEDLAPRKARARGVGGPLRLEPMLDARGDLLPDLIRPRRAAPPGTAPETFLDGSPLQFLEKYQPFPAGISPHALAYNDFMKAYVLQEYEGQRHVQRSVAFVDANPGRALRDWSISAFEEGRLLEAEALGREAIPPGESGERQAALEVSAADVPLSARPVSPDLLRRAVARYRRSVSVGRDAAQWIAGHLRKYPEENATFASAVRRLDALRPLLEADAIYDELILGDAPDAPDAPDSADAAESRRRAAGLYADARARVVDYLIEFHTPREFLPPDTASVADALALPPAEKNRLLDRLRAARGDPRFEHGRAVDEFDGYLRRIDRRLSQLRAADAA